MERKFRTKMNLGRNKSNRSGKARMTTNLPQTKFFHHNETEWKSIVGKSSLMHVWCKADVERIVRFFDSFERCKNFNISRWFCSNVWIKILSLTFPFSVRLILLEKVGKYVESAKRSTNLFYFVDVFYHSFHSKELFTFINNISLAIEGWCSFLFSFCFRQV